MVTDSPNEAPVPALTASNHNGTSQFSMIDGCDGDGGVGVKISTVLGSPWGSPGKSVYLLPCRRHPGPWLVAASLISFSYVIPVPGLLPPFKDPRRTRLSSEPFRTMSSILRSL